MSAGPADHGQIRPEPPSTYYDGLVKIPGMDGPPSRCRPYSPIGFCEAGHPLLGRSSCGVRYCPDHWRDWIEDAVINAVARLAAWRHLQEPRAGHVVASPPPDRKYSLRELWDTRGDAYDALEESGVPGGAVITHPYAATDRGKNLYATAQESGDLPESTGIWRFLREISDGWDDLERYIEARPHYHAIAPIGDVQPEAADGWVVKRIRTFKPFYYQDTEAYRDMASAMYYVLTHSGVQDGRQATTYFGQLHPASFDPEESLTAAAWDRIQREAEKAVKSDREAGDGAEETGEECPRDGCEAEVIPIRYLADRVNDQDWMTQLKAGPEGIDRWLAIRGLARWWVEGGPPPPPQIRQDKERLIEWLRRNGQVHEPRNSAPSTRQSALTSATNVGPSW